MQIWRLDRPTSQPLISGLCGFCGLWRTPPTQTWSFTGCSPCTGHVSCLREAFSPSPFETVPVLRQLSSGWLHTTDRKFLKHGWSIYVSRSLCLSWPNMDILSQSSKESQEWENKSDRESFWSSLNVCVLAYSLFLQSPVHLFCYVLLCEALCDVQQHVTYLSTDWKLWEPELAFTFSSPFQILLTLLQVFEVRAKVETSVAVCLRGVALLSSGSALWGRISAGRSCNSPDSTGSSCWSWRENLRNLENFMTLSSSTQPARSNYGLY